MATIENQAAAPQRVRGARQSTCETSHESRIHAAVGSWIQDTSNADEIGLFAGDTSKPLSLAAAPIILTAGGTLFGIEGKAAYEAAISAFKT